MAKSKTVKVNCRGAGTISVDQLSPLQGALKTLTPENYAKFKAEVERDGFIEPVSIWEDPKSAKLYILNGHQRVDGLKRMRDEGWTLPQIPVNYVEAKNLKEAKQKLLAMASQYGIVNPQGLYDFAVEAGVTREEISTYYNFSDFDPDKFLREYFPEGKPDVPDVTVEPPQASTVIGMDAPPIPAAPPAKKEKAKNDNTGELKQEDFEVYDHVCPRCRFEFNDPK